MVKNMPANEEDTGSIPGRGVFHLPQGNKAHAPQLLKPTHVEPVLCHKRSHRKEKPKHCKEE